MNIRASSHATCLICGGMGWTSRPHAGCRVVTKEGEVIYDGGWTWTRWPCPFCKKPQAVKETP